MLTMLKKFIVGAIAGAVLSVPLAGVAGADPVPGPGSNNAAENNKHFTCRIFDGNDVLQFTDQSHSVVTSSGNTTVKCKATVTPSSTGQVVKREGFPCGTFLGVTNDSLEIISASGEAMLTCIVH